MISSLRILPILVAVFCILTPAISSALNLQLVIRATKDAAGDPNNYRISAGPFFNSNVVAPDGTQFQIGATEVTGLSLADLASRFVGEWTINDNSPLTGGVTQQHQFTIAAPALLEDYPPTPVILTPAEGAIVPPTFELQWLGESSSIFQVSGFTQAEFTQLGENHLQVTPEFAPGETSKDVTVTAINVHLSDLPFAATSVANPVNNFDPRIDRRSSSLPRNFTVVANVPEPHSFGLASIAIAAMLAAARARGVI